MFKYTPNRAEGAKIFGCFDQKVSFCPPLFGRFTEQGGAKTQGYDMMENDPSQVGRISQNPGLAGSFRYEILDIPRKNIQNDGKPC